MEEEAGARAQRLRAENRVRDRPRVQYENSPQHLGTKLWGVALPQVPPPLPEGQLAQSTCPGAHCQRPPVVPGPRRCPRSAAGPRTAGESSWCGPLQVWSPGMSVWEEQQNVMATAGQLTVSLQPVVVP